MRSVALLALAVLMVTCGPDPNAQLPGYIVQAGGATSAGSGGGAGGRAGSGGASLPGTGGRRVGTGGATETGGAVEGTGGRTSGSGGRTTGRDAGVDIRPDTARGTGGTGSGGGGGRTVIVRDAGRGGSGGSTDAGRDLPAGRDARPVGTGGSGGSTGNRDAPVVSRDSGGGGSCYDDIVANGYACGSAAPCSECKVNNESKEAECKKGIDCLAAAGANCDSNCQLNCLNQAGDAQVGACIKALTTPACGGSGC